MGDLVCHRTQVDQFLQDFTDGDGEEAVVLDRMLKMLLQDAWGVQEARCYSRYYSLGFRAKSTSNMHVSVRMDVRVACMCVCVIVTVHTQIPMCRCKSSKSTNSGLIIL